MPIAVTIPKLDKEMERGVIAQWHVPEGEAVTKGDVLFEIETDKAAVEVEAPGNGTLHHVSIAAGEEAAIGHPVAWIYADGEEVGDRPEAPQAEGGGETAATASPAKEQPSAGAPRDAEEPASDAFVTATAASPGDEAATSGERLLVTPAAQQAARKHGVSLGSLVGTGPSGRIQKSDVLVAAARLEHEPRPPAAPGSRPPARTCEGAEPLAVLRSGRGDRLPMIMIHGFLADASGWTLIEKPLSRDRPIYRVELPNHGRSPRRPVDGFAGLAAELRRCFDALDVEQCHLVGHSLGGAAALALADTRPRKVASLTLISPAGLGPEINGDAIFGICRASRSESLGPWLQLLTGDRDTIGWSYVQAAAATRSDPELRAAQHAMAERLFPDGVQAFDLRSSLERLEMPCRIVWGKADRMIPWKHALTAPGAVSLNLFSGIGHMPHYEHPEQLATLLRPLP